MPRRGGRGGRKGHGTEQTYLGTAPLLQAAKKGLRDVVLSGSLQCQGKVMIQYIPVCPVWGCQIGVPDWEVQIIPDSPQVLMEPFLPGPTWQPATHGSNGDVVGGGA